MNNILAELIKSNILGFVLSMFLPLLFLIVMIKNKESKYILAFFAWGIFSVIIAFIFNEWFMQPVGQTERITSDVAPIIEEILKALPLLLFIVKKKIKGNLIIYCAMASGIGFSIQETLYYFSTLTANSGLSDLLLIFFRTITTCLMHGMATAIIGFGMTITASYKNIRMPIILGLLALSSTIHSLFNILLGTHLAFISVILPIILYLLGLALLSSDNEEDGE